MFTISDLLVETWRQRVEALHPMTFDGCENSKENFLRMVAEFDERPNETKRQFIEATLQTFELSSSGWEAEKVI